MRPLLRLLSLVLTLLLLAGPQGVGAQETQMPDYAQWEKDATRAEQAVADARASDSAMGDLRDDVVAWRSAFLAAQSANQSRIETLRGQISALGAAPGEGETEAPEIAARRAELSDQLAKLQAPGISAVEAASRADGIVRGIDRVLRERQADALLRLSPSPLNPANWPAALVALTGVVTAVWTETANRVAKVGGLDEAKNYAPAIVLSLLVALVLLARGRRGMERLGHRLLGISSMRGRQVVSTVVSLGQIVLPLVGVRLLVTAFELSGLFGDRGMAILAQLPAMGLLILVAYWLGGRIFPRDDEQDAALTLLSERRAEGRFLTAMMGVVLAIQGFIQVSVVPQTGAALAVGMLTGNVPMAIPAETTDAAAAVIQLPLLLVAALLLFRAGQLLRRHVRNQPVSDSEHGFRDRLVKFVANGAIMVAVLAPGLAVVGYISAANALIWPSILSLGLMALLGVLQKFATDVYGLITRDAVGARDALVPVLIGFGLSVIALPVFALIWGMRFDELVEIWQSFRSGISLGGVRISPTIFLTFAVVFGIGYGATRLLQGVLRSSILPKTRIDKGGQNAIISGIGYFGIFLAAVLAISSAGIDLSSLAIVAGALSVGIGFGLQNIVSNFVSGIILLIERPISEGDWIEVGGQQGVVRAISVRSTRIETFDRTDVIVPNADLVSGVVTNWTRGNLTGRAIVPVGVAYGSDTRRVEAILREVAHDHPLVMMNPEPKVYLMGFGADSVDFEIRAILSDVNFKLAVTSEMNHHILRRFAEEGIEIPFPQRDVWLRNPEALRPQPQHGPYVAAAMAPPEAGEGISVPHAAPAHDAPMRTRAVSDDTDESEDDPEDSV